MKIYLLLLVSFLFCCTSFAQTDTLYLKSGNWITGKVLEFNGKKVRYKTQEDQILDIEGEISTKSLKAINKSDGTIFLLEDTVWTEITHSALDDVRMNNDQYAYNKGLLDGSRLYNHTGPGSAALLLNIVCVGLIPSIIMAQVQPNDRYFNIKDKSLYRNEVYMKGFNHAAFTVKKKKVFKNTVIGISIPILFYVFSRVAR